MNTTIKKSVILPPWVLHKRDISNVVASSRAQNLITAIENSGAAEGPLPQLPQTPSLESSFSESSVARSSPVASTTLPLRPIEWVDLDEPVMEALPAIPDARPEGTSAASRLGPSPISVPVVVPEPSAEPISTEPIPGPRPTPIPTLTPVVNPGAKPPISGTTPGTPAAPGAPGGRPAVPGTPAVPPGTTPAVPGTGPVVGPGTPGVAPANPAGTSPASGVVAANLLGVNSQLMGKESISATSSGLLDLAEFQLRKWHLSKMDAQENKTLLKCIKVIESFDLPASEKLKLYLETRNDVVKFSNEKIEAFKETRISKIRNFVAGTPTIFALLALFGAIQIAFWPAFLVVVGLAALSFLIAMLSVKLEVSVDYTALTDRLVAGLYQRTGFTGYEFSDGKKPVPVELIL